MRAKTAVVSLRTKTRLENEFSYAYLRRGTSLRGSSRSGKATNGLVEDVEMK